MNDSKINFSEKDTKIRLTSQGRISRAVFWKYIFAAVLSLFIFGITADALGDLVNYRVSQSIQCVGMILFIAFFIFGTARRFHDLGIGDWAVLLLFVPFINIIAILVCGFIPGKPNPNKYG